MKKLIFILIFFGSFATFSQLEKNKLKTFTFKEVAKLHQKKPKPIIVFIYTDWCKFCHGMKKNGLNNNEIITLLNENFYFIELNGEEKKDITFLGKTFVYKPTGKNTGIHELVNELATINKRITYPTTIVLNSKRTIEAQFNYYLTSKNLKTILTHYIFLKK
jgi:thioredoxin-related protein